MDISLPAASVSFPVSSNLGTEYESELFAIRRIGSKLRIGQWQFFCSTPGSRNIIELRESCLATFTGRSEENFLSISGPVNHSVGITMRGESEWNSPGSGD